MGGGNKPTAPGARGNAPLLPPAAASSPEGQICSSLTPCANLSCSIDSVAKTSPSGGSPRRGIGVHFRRAAGPVLLFSLPLAALPPLAAYKTHRPIGRYHHPLNLLNPLNPLNPHARKGAPQKNSPFGEFPSRGNIFIYLWYGRGRGRSCGGNGGGVRFPEWTEVPVPFPGWRRSVSGRSGK